MLSKLNTTLAQKLKILGKQFIPKRNFGNFPFIENSGKWKYPVSRRDEFATNQLGMHDPYKWLEDPDSQETVQWVDSQNQITNSLIESWPHREKLRQKLTEIFNYPKYSSPMKEGDYYYFFKNDGLQNQFVMYQQKSLDDEPQVFLDLNKFSEDGTVSLGSYSFTESGKFFAYSISRSGSDWKTVYIMSTDTKEVLKDQLDWVKYSEFAWTHDDLGFFYVRFDKPQKIDSAESLKAGAETDKNTGMKICYHKLGTSQDEDLLIYELPEEPEYLFRQKVTDDGKYLILSTNKGTNRENLIDYADLQNFQKEKKINFIRVIDNMDSIFNYVTNNGTLFYFVTSENAPRKKIVAFDITNPSKENIKDIIPQQAEVLESAICVNENYLVLAYNKDVHHILYLHSLEDGKFIKEIILPSFGTAYTSGYRKDREFFCFFTSFLYPGTILRYDFESNESLVFRETEIKGLVQEKFETKQVFYKSKDGTQIPMYITQSKGANQDGTRPTLLYGYGGFSIPIMPFFDPFNIVYIENLGFNLTIANIRGGSEYGEEWHKAGMREKKQNVFDDFIAAGEYLIENKYTNNKKLIIQGGSNGGLLVCACLNQRPDLFGCVISQVGVLDMLRFHLFTVGQYWKTEYGDPDNPEDLKFISKYSPLHNITKGKEYPPTLLLTADHDDRAVPLHSYKFIATLQHELGTEEYQKNPLMIKIETKAGHGEGKPTAKIIEEFVDIYSFVGETLNIAWIESDANSKL